MANYVEGSAALHKLNEEQPLQSTAQLVYLHLLWLNHCLGNTGTVEISDRQLAIRTSLNKQSITDAKRFLKNRGLIDFSKGKGKSTEYTLLFFAKEEHPVGQSVGHPVGQSARLSTLSYPGDKPAPPPKGGPANEPVDEQTDHAPACEDEFEELLDYWERDLHGGRLTIEHQSELEVYLRDKGLEWVKETMREASDGNNNPRGMQPKFLFAVIKRKLAEAEGKPKTGKGGSQWEFNAAALEELARISGRK